MHPPVGGGETVTWSPVCPGCGDVVTSVRVPGRWRRPEARKAEGRVEWTCPACGEPGGDADEIVWVSDGASGVLSADRVGA